MEVLFDFLAERYESRSVIVTSNLPLGEWDRIFRNPMTTMAAIDRLVHHAHILELTCDSYRAREAVMRKNGGG
jgi:DNA replication protein DnaC